MRVIGLISGGKDSIYNIMQCVAAGHEIVGLANMEPPPNKDELDSYMYQTVGHEGIIQIARSIGLPLIRYVTEGKAKTHEKDYVPSENDEVEDLFKLLQHIKTTIEFDAVAVGAILSDYQRIRVENVCSRLNLVTLAYLWRRNQTELLNEMIDCGIRAVIVKVASLGLEPTKHLGVPLSVMRPHLLRMHEKYGLHVCGEGGEYETFTMDCPLYSSTIVVDESETIIHSNDAIAPVGYMYFKKIRLVPKNNQAENLNNEEIINDLPNRIAPFNVKTPLSFVEDISTDSVELNDDSDDENNENLQTELISTSHVPNYGKTPGGWLWLGDLVGESEDITVAMAQALEKLQSCIHEAGYKIQDVCAVTMYISDMTQFKALNEVYRRTFKYSNPPTRVCVQCPLNRNTPILLDALAYSKKLCVAQTNVNVEESNGSGDEKVTCPARITMHVQGISHWAPANIGPYSQAVQVGEIFRVAGQIGMVPGTLDLIEGGVLKQCRLSLRHIGRIAAALDPNMQIRDVVQGVCYVTKSKYIQIAREEWENQTNNAIVDYVVVSSLPKSAKIEWHLWAHKYNNQFEYQETGECIDNYLLSIRRRFNYENNVAAIVCHIEHRNREQDSFLPEGCLSSRLIIATIEYALKKLNQDYVPNTDLSGTVDSDQHPLCNLRFFYPINNKNIDVIELHQILIDNRLKYNIVFTIIPVLQLQSENILLSICGVRYE